MTEQYIINQAQTISAAYHTPAGMISQHSNKYVDDYILMEEIGSGEYGKVYKAKNLKTHEIFAIKVLSLKAFSASNRLQDMIHNEVQTLQKISSPYIIKIFKLLKTTNNVYLVYDYCDGGTLEQLIQINKILPESQALLYFRQIFDAVHTIVNNNVLHRDIKLANIFLHQGSVKLGDFGFCVLVNNETKEYAEKDNALIGTPLYMAPEVLNGAKPNPISEMYSLGVVLFEMLFGACPYEDANTTDLKTLIEKLKSIELLIPKNINKIGSLTETILNGTLKKNPAERMTWEELKILLHSGGRVVQAGIGSSYTISTTGQSPPGLGSKITSLSPRREYFSPSPRDTNTNSGSITERKEVPETGFRKNVFADKERRVGDSTRKNGGSPGDNKSPRNNYITPSRVDEKNKQGGSFEGNLTTAALEKKNTNSAFYQQSKFEGSTNTTKFDSTSSPRLNRKAEDYRTSEANTSYIQSHNSNRSTEKSNEFSKDRTRMENSYSSGYRANDTSSSTITNSVSPSTTKIEGEKLAGSTTYFTSGASYGSPANINKSELSSKEKLGKAGNIISTAAYTVSYNKESRKETPRRGIKDLLSKVNENPETHNGGGLGTTVSKGNNTYSYNKETPSEAQTIKSNLLTSTSEFNSGFFETKTTENQKERAQSVEKQAETSPSIEIKKILFKERNKIVFLMKVLKESRDMCGEGLDAINSKYGYFLLKLMLKLSDDFIRNLKDNPRRIFKNLLFDWRDYEKSQEFLYIDEMLQQENKLISNNLKEFGDILKANTSNENFRSDFIFSMQHYIYKEEFAEETILYVKSKIDALDSIEQRDRTKLLVHLLQALDSINLDEHFEEFINADELSLDRQDIWRELSSCSFSSLKEQVDQKLSLFSSLYGQKANKSVF